MKKLGVMVLVLFVLVSGLNAGLMKERFGLGAGWSMGKHWSNYDYIAAGQDWWGHLKFGVLDELEVGFQGGYMTDWPATNIEEAPFRMRLATGDTLPYGVTIQRQPSGINNDNRPYRVKPDGNRDKAIGLSFDKGSLPFHYEYIPLELFVQARALAKSIFNPFMTVGFGRTSWSVKDNETGKVYDVLDQDNNWKAFKGEMYNLLFGIGFEVFPVNDVGITVLAQSRYFFADEFTQYVFDTLGAQTDLGARLTFYYGGIKDSDRDGIRDNKDECPDTPFGAVVDEQGCPMDSDGDGVFDGLDLCPNTPPRAIVDAGGCPRDSDGDGIYDGIDRCTDTPTGAKVDSVGCPVDTDNDGIPDYKDRCPNTPLGALVGEFGCPKDSDGDGVYDGLDLCPNTPPGTPVNVNGCEVKPGDSDGDGIPDDVDKCPDTPSGVRVDAVGCPVDSDGDGIPDYRDNCPRTPKRAIVDTLGCPMDTDNDGVYDGIDKCPSTPSGVRVDSVGCPMDSDGDGVYDGADKCPGTPRGALVDAAGCPMDSDGDGVYDGLDKCPNTPADIEVDSVGCPKVKKLEKGESIRVKVYFETAKWDITPKGEEDLKEVLMMLKAYPEMRVLIEGHTDNVGGEKYNLELSTKRALSVKNWLVKNGIDPSRLETRGFGYSRPVDTNDTPEGRANNRRIEFKRID
ncbi:MAG: hypothetical protein B6D65_00545 [candidate division Zixibacteria bacterium 4484_93]|nr:MAG: hypothetical protein B6D65_00545 [candidate division Zixibacteria bacterium 4484_93]